MRFVHRAHPGRCVRLAYCLNVHPAASLAEFRRGLETVATPLRERLAPSEPFGLGMYLSAQVARELLETPGELERLRAEFAQREFDPFTYNAFPHGGFGDSGLKARVFEPAWWDAARSRYTLDVARIACALRSSPGPLSISTHTGAHSSALGAHSRAERIRQCGESWRELAEQLRALGAERVSIALEPEPDSLLGSVAELAAQGPRVEGFGACLDTCHAAVMFEPARDTVERALSFGRGLAKLQFTSALAVRDPARNTRGREALLALDEPRYLHQLTARAEDGSLALVSDLDRARARFAAGERALASAEEWRCHFHVPVDLEGLEALGLEVTSAFADEALACVLAQPERWQGGELHLEVETYTWSILPGLARGPGDLVDGLEREYRHVIERLARAGWRSG
jgi:hypothetical protein